MSDKEKLRQMLDHLIDGQSQQAQTDFHQYLQGLLRGRVQDNTSTDHDND